MPDADPTVHAATVDAAAAGQRLDKWLAAAVPALSRSRLKALIAEGRVAVDGATVDDPAYRVKPGQHATVAEPPPEPAAPQPEAIPLTVVYEDEALLVVDKPAGLTVHPGAGTPDGTLVNALLHHCGDHLSGAPGDIRRGIVHRLDKDTSGLLVVAKTDSAHESLAARIAEHAVERVYYAVVHGHPAPPAGTIEGAIGRHPVDRKRMTIRNDGRPATTHYRTLRWCGNAAALVECRLATGRTHQIRVHFAHRGHPLVGDPVYGRGGGVAVVRAFPRQALHAAILGFRHPLSGKWLRFESALSGDITDLLSRLECM